MIYFTFINKNKLLIQRSGFTQYQQNIKVCQFTESIKIRLMPFQYFYVLKHD